MDGSPPRVLWWSHAGDDARDVWRHLGLDSTQGRALSAKEAEKARAARKVAERAETARKMAYCREIWGGTVPADGTPVAAYLKSRGLFGAIPQTIRFHPAAPVAYPTQDRPAPPTFPSMVAIATSPDGASAAGLHVTALLPDGSGKAALRQPRRMFGELAGAVVQLSPIPESGELAVAEGLETALSYRALAGTPTWATLSTSLMRRFEPPPGVKRLVIAADGDPAGLEAARELAERASRRCECVVMAAPEGTDWNDCLRGTAQ